jgi:hypothetical protein
VKRIKNVLYVDRRVICRKTVLRIRKAAQLLEERYAIDVAESIIAWRNAKRLPRNNHRNGNEKAA